MLNLNNERNVAARIAIAAVCPVIIAIRLATHYISMIAEAFAYLVSNTDHGKIEAKFLLAVW